MIKEAIQYIQEQTEDNLSKFMGDRYYGSKNLVAIKEPKATVLQINTLNGLIDYIKSTMLGFDTKDFIMVHISSPHEVVVYSPLSKQDRERECFIKAICKDYFAITGNHFMSPDKFRMFLMTSFVHDPKTQDDLTDLLELTTKLMRTKEYVIEDDGSIQSVLVQETVSLKDRKQIEPYKILQPYRTFLEIEQPKTEFLFRMQSPTSSGIEIGLFESDGGFWRMAAIEHIFEFLKNNLPEGVTIIR